MSDSGSEFGDGDDGDNGTGGEFAPVDGDDEIDFYALLNVPRDASTDEINRAYRQRCLVFHPDRHMDTTDKKDAERIFVLLRRAHETLIDDDKRAIYDTVGIRGLDLQGWELISRAANVEDIRREYEFLMRLRDTETMLQRIRPGGTFICKSSIAGLFPENPDDRYPPQMLGMFLSQSVESAWTSHDRVGLAGRVKTGNGRGDGSVTVSWKRSMSALTMFENNLTFAGDSIAWAGKFGRNIFSKSIVILQPTLQYSLLRSQLDYGVSLIYTQRLSPSWQGTIVMQFGMQPAITTSVVYMEQNQPKVACNVTVSPSNSQVRVVHTYRSQEADEAVCESACSLGLFGVMSSINYERRLSRFSRIGVAVTAVLPAGGLIAKFRLKSGLNTYEWHLQLCNDQEDLVRSALIGIVAPFVVFQVGKRLLGSWTERIAAIFDDRSEAQQVNSLRRDDASRATDLMRATADRIARVETARHGLVIVEARYGQLIRSRGGDANAYPVEGEMTIDVAVALQAMVNDSQLRIYNAGKDQLPGFYDPCPGEPKMLRVVYRFRDEMHSVIVPDEAPLNIPMQCKFV